MGRSVCKLAGLKAYSDHQNPKKVAMHGKTAYVGLHPQLVDRFTSFLLRCLFFEDSITPKIMLFGNMGGLLWKFCGKK